MGTTIENRPAMPFATMSTDELATYASIYAVTALEIQLNERLTKLLGHSCRPEEDGVCQCCGSPVVITK